MSLILIIIAALASAPPMSSLEDGIWAVETGRRTGPVHGDGGRALGPLQIHRGCWLDVRRAGEEYADCSDLGYSLEVFRRYAARYATADRLGHKPTDRDLAFLWNGGPSAHRATGKKKENLDRYWRRVKKESTE